jgi:hypothetical protein
MNSGNNSAVGDNNSNRYAYVMQEKETSLGWRKFLTQIDLKTLEIKNEIKVNKPYSYLTLLKNGDVLLTYSHDATSLKQIVDKYSVKKNKVTSFIKTKDYYPSVVIPYKSQKFVLMTAHSSADLRFEVFNRKGEYKDTIQIAKEAMCIYGSIMFSDDKKTLWLFLDDFSDKTYDSIPRLVSLNLDTKVTTNITTNFLNELSSIDAVAFNQSDKKIYVSSSSKKLNSDEEKTKINHDVYVYSYPDLKLLNQIPTGKQPDYLVFYPEQKKLYVSHGLSMSVIDTQTEKVIKTFPFHAKRIEKVADDKLMIWHYEHIFGKDPNTGAETTLRVDDKIIVLDVVNDKVLKEFVGHFGPISRNPNLHWQLNEVNK